MKTAPKTINDAVSYNPAFLVLCWDVETPDGIVSVYSQNRALQIAREAWPELAASSTIPSHQSRTGE